MTPTSQDWLLWISLAWGGIALLLLWRMVALLRRMAAALREAQKNAEVDLRRHHEELTRLLSAIRGFMEQSAETLDSKAERLRQLIEQAERVAERPGKPPAQPPRPPQPAARPEPPKPTPTPTIPPASELHREVLERLSNGESQEQVAHAMNLSVREVELIARLQRRS